MFGYAHPATAQNAWLLKLNNEQQFLSLAGKPLTDKYSGTQAVKVVLVRSDRKLYFLSSRAYQFHRDFCTNVLGNADELGRFNLLNYKKNYAREYVFATINFYPEKKIYTLEFSDIEIFSEDNIEIYKMVKAASFMGQKLKWHPITDNQTAFLKEQKEVGNSITSNELYAGMSRQMLVKGSAVGRLRRIHIDTLANTKINPWDIVLTNGSPNEIDLCAGLIITKFQSPLSHINILCHNRGTPVMAYKNAYDDPKILALVGSPIRFEIEEDFKISLAQPEELQRMMAQSKQKKIINLAIDKSYDQLTDFEKIAHRHVASVGGKAANLGELLNVRRLPKSCLLPEQGFAIPMVYYLQHFKASGAEDLLTDLIKDSLLMNDKVGLSKRLKEIRKAMKQYPLDTVFYKQVNKKLAERGYQKNDRIRFRSSTNAEDIKGFNGAGLYSSCTGIFETTESKTVERAIKKVWSSVWNEGAFRERAYFNINQQSVAMGIAVHKAFGTEEVNGVAITKNLYRKNDEAYVINAQLGETAIVAGKDSALSELSILSKSGYDQAVHNDYISYSSLNNAQALMTEKQLIDLFESLERIKQHYYFRVRDDDTPYADYALDVEFKIKNGVLIIKQVRLYN